MEEQAKAIEAEARSWLRTPYHSHAGIKGVGVDCAWLLIRVYHALGLIPDIDPGYYPPDWHLHRSEERYLWWLFQYGREVKAPARGGVAVFKIGRCYSHGAIVLQWPLVIHSYIGRGVELAQTNQGMLAKYAGAARFFEVGAPQ